MKGDGRRWPDPTPDCAIRALRLFSQSTMSGAPSNTLPPIAGPGAPASERLPDMVCIAFAVWTLCTHAVVALGGSLDRLIIVAGLAGAAVAIGLLWQRRRQVPTAIAACKEGPEFQAPATGARVVAGVAAAAALAAWAATGDLLLWWWCAVAFLGIAAVVVMRRAPEPLLQSVKSRRAEIFLWTLSLACIVGTLVVHRFDIDDAFYLNVAVAAADNPSRALFASDTLLRIPDLAIHNPAHRILTLELLNAAVSRLSGIPAIVCLHVLTAGFVALLIPLAQARLYRRLLPQPLAWTAAVFATTAILWCAGDTHRSFGNYAFVRAWQGKAIFLSVAMPLIYAYGVRYSATGSSRDWLRLAAAQIASVGLTSTAIWAAPLAGGLVLASQFRVGARGFVVFTRGIGACLYPLAVGLMLRGEIQDAIAVESPALAAGTWLSGSVSKILGNGYFEYAALGAVLLLVACVRGDRVRRFVIVVPLGALLTVANPYLEESVRSFVTGPSHWRSIWAIPFPILLGLLVASPLATGLWRGRIAAPALYVAALSFVLLLPNSTPLSAPGPDGSLRSRPWSLRGRFPHHVRFGWPGPKVDPVAYEYAQLLARTAPAGTRVVAPEDVVLWLGTIHDAPAPVADRALYMTVRTRQLGADEVKRRKRLNKYSAAPSLDPERLEAFREGLHEYEVGAILIRPVPGDGPLRALLRVEGFDLTQKGGLLDLWRLSARPAVAVPGRAGAPPAPTAPINLGDPAS